MRSAVARSLLVVLLALTYVQVTAVCPPDVPTVNCLVDPCQGRSCALGCASSYCGGCHANCRCRSDVDCATGPSETVGTCIRSATRGALGVCSNSAPSAATAPAASAVPEWKPNHGRKPTCEVIKCRAGYTCREGECVVDAEQPNCAAVQCLAGTTCINGECIRSDAPPAALECGAHHPCSPLQYCGSERKCLALGSCSVPSDCEHDTTFVHSMCVGQATCEANHCGWKCDKMILTP